MGQTEFPAILVVEDEPDVLIVLRRILRDVTIGHDIIAVPDGATAIEQLERQRFALVITDYLMPEVSGIELARFVRARSPETAVVMVTAYATSEVEQAATEAGVQVVLRKPFVVGKLEDAVRVALSR